jgi:hypothetical protein
VPISKRFRNEIADGCGTDRGGIDHPDDLSSRLEPGAVSALHLDLWFLAATLRWAPSTLGGWSSTARPWFLCHATTYHNRYQK